RMLASIQPASVNQNTGDLGIRNDSEIRGNALEYGQTSPALVFVDDALIEINLLPEISGGLFLDGLDLMAKERDVVAALRKRDDAAKERNGLIIFPRLGIALSGFEPPQADQKAVTVFGPNHPWSTP
ncbi:hypothetical protein, partial [Aliirhizobium cellulosilyticum]